jgi:hypothetical protein
MDNNAFEVEPGFRVAERLQVNCCHVQVGSVRVQDFPGSPTL